jgi:non-heme chloroperoxidase
MRKRIIGLGALAGLVGAVHWQARRMAVQITANPDPYTLDELLRVPSGEQVFIERPDGTRLRAIVAGKGRTVVFAHGYGTDLSEWNVIWERLRGTHRLICYDQRGHGGSSIGTDGIGSAVMADDLGAVLDHFDVQDGLLVGHSMGGFLSLIFLLDHARKAGARLRRALIVASFAGDVTNGAPQTRLQIPLIQSGVLPALTRTYTYGWAFAATLFGPRPFASGVEAFRRVFSAQNHAPLVPILRALEQENYYPRLGEIGLPCLILCGDGDKTTPKHHSENLVAGIPGATFVRVPEVGHIINWEAPEPILDAIRSTWTH